MCGIAGMMTLNGSPPPPAVLDAMARLLRHRGPDGSGQHRSGDVGMAHLRLAVEDPAGRGPPLYDPGGAALILNGEIYNGRELSAELPPGGAALHAGALPLHLYRRHGLDFARHLRGMYAIALHDPAAGRLVLARDPFGIKPLYYAETAQGLAFASEPHSLIRSGLVTAELVRQSRNELLQLQFTTGRDTIFAGISRVLPGETVVVTKGRIVDRRQREALPAGGTLALDEAAALAAFDSAFMDSVAVHQPPAAPFGMFLSGGVDSSAVLAMMARLDRRPVQAFTIGFTRAADIDERVAAHAVAQQLGAEHIEVEFREADFWRLLPEIARAMDDPAADYSMLPTWKLAATARDAGAKVILSGEGGDELFAGYGRYRSVMRPWWAGGKLIRGRGNLDRLGLLRGDLAGWRDGVAAAEFAATNPGRSRLQVAQATDCADWLPNDLMTKLDRCLMAHGIEGRTPLLDPLVAELAFRLPDGLKLRRGVGKWLLRRWVEINVPAAEPFAPKRGFTVPVGHWIARRGVQLGPLVAAQPGVREICLPEMVEKLFRDPTRHRHESFAAWTLLFYALWHRQHIEGLAPEADVFATLSARG